MLIYLIILYDLNVWCIQLHFTLNEHMTQTCRIILSCESLTVITNMLILANFAI